MENPFETIEARLAAIEEKLSQLIEVVQGPNSKNKNTRVTTKQLADYLGVSTTTITNMRISKFPYYKVGGKILFKKEEIDLVLENTRHKSGGEYLSEYLKKNQL